MIDVLTLGEALVSFRTPGPLAEVWHAEAHVAGAEANVAIGLARLGHRSAWVGCVSDDDLGRWVSGTLAGEGVDTRFIRRVPGASAGAMVLVDPLDHARRVTYLRRGSAGSRLEPSDALAAIEAGVQWVHLSGITPALSESARDAWVGLAREARTRSVRVCLDVNFRSALWSRDEAAKALDSVRGLVDLLVASEDEVDLVDTARIPTVVVKRGSAGATLITAEGSTDVPAVDVPVVDVIGAGDALCAGLLSGLLDGLTPVDALRRGAWVAGRCVASTGDWEGLPTRVGLSHMGTALSPERFRD